MCTLNEPVAVLNSVYDATSNTDLHCLMCCDASIVSSTKPHPLAVAVCFFIIISYCSSSFLIVFAWVSDCKDHADTHVGWNSLSWTELYRLLIFIYLFIYLSIYLFVSLLVPPKGGRGCLMSPPCLESQDCHLIPLYYLLSCSSA